VEQYKQECGTREEAGILGAEQMDELTEMICSKLLPEL